MYTRILLAFDGTVEGRAALREGALLARRCGASIFLLSVIADNAGIHLAQGLNPNALLLNENVYQSVLAEGVSRLRNLGFEPTSKLVRGEPAREIGAFAKEVGADLVVVGYRRQNALSRWWSGPTDAHLVDYVQCSVLISRNPISSELFEAEMRVFPTVARNHQ